MSDEVTEKEKDEKGREILGKIQCFCCGADVLVRNSKTTKPFFTCSCGTHVFFRQLKSIKCIHALIHGETAANDDGSTKQGKVVPESAKKESWLACL